MQSFNYTNKIQLDENEIKAIYREVKENNYIITLKWDLSAHNIVEDYNLFYELKGQHTTETRRQAIEVTTGLTEYGFEFLGDPDLIKIRFIAVASRNSIPMIIAERDQILPLSEDGRSRSFLKIHKLDNLDVAWEINFDDNIPILNISSHSKIYENRNYFLPIILPNVVQQIFEWLVLSDEDLSGDLLRHWVNYFEDICRKPDMIAELRSKDPEDKNKSVHEESLSIREKFAKKHNTLDAVAHILDRS